MSESLASSRYARALFNLAIKENRLQELETSLLDFAKTVETHPEITSIVQNPTLKEEERFSFIEKILPAKSSDLIKNFLKVLLKKKRFPILGEIQAEFHRLFEKKQNILEVEVISAVPFSTKLHEKLKKMLAAKFCLTPDSKKPETSKEVRLIPKINAELLGGILLRFEGREIDCSFKSRIREIEQQLIAA